MTNDDLRAELEKWGAATVTRFALQHDGPSAGDHILAKQRDFGLKSKRKKEDEREIVGRDGYSRRLMMGAAAGRTLCNRRGEVVMVLPVPMWACDPVRAANDAGAPRDLPPAFVDVGLPDDVRWVDDAIRAMARVNILRAMVVREEFTSSGTQSMKAGRVAKEYGGTLSVRQYRHELARALDWMGGKRAA